MNIPQIGHEDGWDIGSHGEIKDKGYLTYTIWLLAPFINTDWLL